MGFRIRSDELGIGLHNIPLRPTAAAFLSSPIKGLIYEMAVESSTVDCVVVRDENPFLQRKSESEFQKKIFYPIYHPTLLLPESPASVTGCQRNANNLYILYMHNL